MPRVGAVPIALSKYKDSVRSSYLPVKNKSYLELIETLEGFFDDLEADKFFARKYEIIRNTNEIVYNSEYHKKYVDAIKSSTGTYLRSFYCHMRYKSSYNSGNLVWSGTNIGQVGSTGVVTGPHLHFGAYYSNNGSSYYRFNPLKLWGRSFTCGCCGNRVSSNNIINEQNNFDVKINENTSILQISNFLSRERNVGILINETFIDIDTLFSMPEIDIKRFGLKKSDIEKLSYMIKSDTDYDTYFDKLNSMSFRRNLSNKYL